jgi:hypothetical protein
MIINKYLKISFYLLISLVFIYLLFNLNTSITSLSYVLTNFFKSLFPYLFMFLIINQLLIKTNLIYLFGYILQIVFYPLFKLNAKSCSLLLISLLNGFPSSVLYSKIMIDNKKIEINSINKIANYFFLPSFTFVFYLIKNNLSFYYFLILIISLYLPPFIFLIIKRNKDTDKFIKLNELKKELIISFNSFNYLKDLKEIFLNSIMTLINILGMISFYSIITLIIPNLLIRGLCEFSMPSIAILTSKNSEIIKVLLILIILTFSSLSSISQAYIYLDELKLSLLGFIKIRIEMLTLSLFIFNLCLFVYL